MFKHKSESASVTETKQKRDLTKFCAFWCLAISSIVYIAGGVINLILKVITELDEETGLLLIKVGNILVFVGNLALIIAIGIPAYSYVKNKKTGWRIFFWIALGIFALGNVFNLIPQI